MLTWQDHPAGGAGYRIQPEGWTDEAYLKIIYHAEELVPFDPPDRRARREAQKLEREGSVKA